MYLAPNFKIWRISWQARSTFIISNSATSLENEIENALLHSPTDDLRVADLKYRKLIIADEIQQNRRQVERFDLVN
jgi:hypothetical protein